MLVAPPATEIHQAHRVAIKHVQYSKFNFLSSSCQETRAQKVSRKRQQKSCLPVGKQVLFRAVPTSGIDPDGGVVSARQSKRFTAGSKQAMQPLVICSAGPGCPEASRLIELIEVYAAELLCNCCNYPNPMFYPSNPVRQLPILPIQCLSDVYRMTLCLCNVLKTLWRAPA
jgi:hypothetical protein